MTTNGRAPQEPVTIYWFSSGSWLGRLIRRVTKSRFSHNAVMVDGTLYEALGSGIRKLEGRDARRRAAEAVDAISLYLLPGERMRMRAFLDRHVANGYSFAGFVAAGIDAITGWKLIIALDGQYICSGYVAAALVRAGYDPPEDPRLMSPEDLWQWLKGSWPHFPIPRPPRHVAREGTAS